MNSITYLHGYLESIKHFSFWNLYLLTESLYQILIHYTIAGRKEGEHMGYKMLLFTLWNKQMKIQSLNLNIYCFVVYMSPYFFY